MENIIQELLPYAKGFAGVYLIGNVVGFIVVITSFVIMFRYLIKKRKEFDKEFKSRWR